MEEKSRQRVGIGKVGKHLTLKAIVRPTSLFSSILASCREERAVERGEKSIQGGYNASARMQRLSRPCTKACTIQKMDNGRSEPMGRVVSSKRGERWVDKYVAGKKKSGHSL